MRAFGCASSLVFHSSVPFSASSAYTAPLSSPKKAALGAFCTSRCARVSLRLDFFGRTGFLGAASSPIEMALSTPAARRRSNRCSPSWNRANTLGRLRSRRIPDRRRWWVGRRRCRPGTRTPISMRASGRRSRGSPAPADNGCCRDPGPNHSIARYRARRDPRDPCTGFLSGSASRGGGFRRPRKAARAQRQRSHMSRRRHQRFSIGW